MNFEYSPAETAAHAAFAAFCEARLAPAAAIFDRADAAAAQALLREQLVALAAEGYLGLHLPKSHGGAGEPLVSALPLHEALAEACASTYLAATSSDLAALLIARAAAPAVQAHWLPALARGAALAAVAVSEEEAGAEPGDIRTAAVRRPGGWTLTGGKTLIANAPDADVVLVLAVTDPAAGAHGWFCVPRGTPGFVAGPARETSGLRGVAIGDLWFRDCALPEEALVGAPAAGRGWLEELWAVGGIRFAALALGLSAACLRLALQEATTRKRGGKPILRDQEVAFKLADMRTAGDAARELTRYAAWTYDRGGSEARVLAACAKLLASEGATKAAHMAVQIFGGAGYLAGSAVERIQRDARFCELGMGTSEVQRGRIAAWLLDRYR